MVHRDCDDDVFAGDERAAAFLLCSNTGGQTAGGAVLGATVKTDPCRFAAAADELGQVASRAFHQGVLWHPCRIPSHACEGFFEQPAEYTEHD